MLNLLTEILPLCVLFSVAICNKKGTHVFMSMGKSQRSSVDDGGSVDYWGVVYEGSDVREGSVVCRGIVRWGIVTYDALGRDRRVVQRQETSVGCGQHGA